MQLRASISDLFGEPALDVHVDVLERFVPLKFSGIDFLLDCAESGFDLCFFRSGDNPHFNQRGRVRDGAGNVMPVKPTVEGNGLAVTLRDLAQ